MIAIGCDHGGFDLKLEIIDYLKASSLEYIDFGTYTKESVDYPRFAKEVANAILTGQCDKGILLCSTGIGISIAANRYKGIRAALCHDVYSARATRLHNNANILVMGGKVVGAGVAIEVLKTFLETGFSNELRHCQRVAQIDEINN